MCFCRIFCESFTFRQSIYALWSEMLPSSSIQSFSGASSSKSKKSASNYSRRAKTTTISATATEPPVSEQEALCDWRCLLERGTYVRELQKSKKNVLTLIGKNPFCDFLKFVAIIARSNHHNQRFCDQN